MKKFELFQKIIELVWKEVRRIDRHLWCTYIIVLVYKKQWRDSYRVIAVRPFSEAKNEEIEEGL